MNAAFLTGLDVNTPSWDLFIYLFFLVAIFVYGFTLGRSRILLLIISTYLALAVVRSMPWLFPQQVTVGSSPFFVVQITIFLAGMLIIFFMLANSALRRSLGMEEKQGSTLQVILFSIAHAGLLIASVMSFIPPERLATLLDSTRAVFTSPGWLFFWTIAPIALMMTVKDKEEE